VHIDLPIRVLLLPSGIDPGGCFHFITVQGRHLFKKTAFTVSTLPRARPQPPCPGKGYVDVVRKERV